MHVVVIGTEIKVKLLLLYTKWGSNFRELFSSEFATQIFIFRLKHHRHHQQQLIDGRDAHTTRSEANCTHRPCYLLGGIQHMCNITAPRRSLIHVHVYLLCKSIYNYLYSYLLT